MMNLVVGILGIVFLVFVVFVAIKGRKAKRVATEQISHDMEYIYQRTQKRHQKKKGRASSELAEARATHLRVINGRASASKP